MGTSRREKLEKFVSMKIRLIFWVGLLLCLSSVWWRWPAKSAVGRGSARPANFVLAPASASRPAAPAITRADSIADQILALLRAGDPQSLAKVYQKLLPDWVRRDPRAAALFAESPEAAPWRFDLMTVVAQTWADVNVDDAEAWASQLANPTERNMVLGYVAFEEANSDSSRAVQVLGNPLMSDDRRTILIQNLANQWTDQDLQPLYDWLNTQPPSAQRDDWFERVALAQSRNAPAQAAQIVSDDITPGPVQDNAALQVLRQWMQQDQAAAVAWANQFPTALRDLATPILNGNTGGAYLVNN
jgi:hypothetical protein